MAVPQSPATADTDAASEAGFASSFEPNDTQPDWSNATVDSSGVVEGGSGSSPGMQTDIDDGPSDGITAKANAGFTGVKSLHYAGRQTSGGRGYAYNKVFDVDIPVSASTTLSYKIFPALTSEHLGKALPSPSTYVAVDLAFADGTYLRDLSAQDHHRFALDAQGQGTSKTLYANQWNAVRSRIGQVAEGRTITRILVDYDNPTTGKGNFEGWIDDITISGDPPPADRAHLSDWVVTTRGTNSNRGFSRGNTIPATAVPHGFNFWVPATDAGTIRWMYRYQEGNNATNFPELQALSLSHQPYPWGGERNTFQVMPAAGAGEPDPARNARALPFSHQNEVAKPYYYGVTFNNGMRAEIAPTNHAAMMKFTFEDDTSNLIFDNINNRGGLSLDPDKGVLTGYTDVGTSPDRRMFIYAAFDRPVTASGELPDSKRPDVTGYYQFDTSGSDDKTVTMRIATSLISVSQAKRNLELELPADATFDSVKTQARELWDDKLDVITDVQGATPDQLTTLYSSLYRLNLYPNTSYENTGTAADPAHQHASDFAPPAGESTATKTGAKIVSGKSYRVSNFWDTYRTAWPADVLFYPELTGEMIDGALTQYEEGGWLDTAMVGSSSDIAFADAYVKGVTNFDVETAYESAIKNATVAPRNSNAGRQGLETAQFLGYTPSTVGAGMSRALENYLNDFGIATMSKALAEESEPGGPQQERYELDATYFRNRAQHYGNMFDSEVGFFRGREADGDWRLSADQYDPRVWGCDYTETNGWGMAFSVPHDGQGLANLYGGRKKLEQKLDAFFTNPETAQFPGCYGGVIHEMREAAHAQMGQFGISNQPAHHIPYMYNYVGKPAKTQAKVREALSRLFVGSEIGQGYPGDEDTGELSAWYIFSALGFYPLQVGTADYAIGSPLFTAATINLTNGKQVVVEAPNNSPDNVYVQGLRINGEPYDKTHLSHDVLTDGAVLTFDMGAEPSTWGTGNQALPDSITTGDQPPNPLRDLTGPSHGTATVTASEGEAGRLFDNTSGSQLTFTGSGSSVTWKFAGRSKQTARYYTLTSGDEGGGLTAWTLQGSQNGEQWKTVDRRTDQKFRWRNQTRVFDIDDPKAYPYYRLKLATGGSTTSLAEVELLGKPPAQQRQELAASLSPEQTLALPSETAVTRKVTLNVVVTAPGAARVKVDTEAPDGWTVEPANAAMTVRSDGLPTEEQLPLTVTIPAGTEEGEYTVAATASMAGTPSVRTTATIRVTNSIKFTTATSAEEQWLWDADGSQINPAGERFADHNRYFIYRFSLPAETTRATATLEIDNQFRVEVSKDAANWTEALVEEREIRDGSNRAARDIDLAPFLGKDRVVYLKVSDSHPSDGWGGRVEQVTVTMHDS